MMTFINWESLLKITHAENYLVVYLTVAIRAIHPCRLEHTQADILCSHSDINALIFDYLTTEGYPSAAAKFSKEANLRPQQEEESLLARRQIIQAIHSGKIQEAIEYLNDLEPQVSRSPAVNFPCYD